MADLTGMLQAAAGSTQSSAYQIERSLRFNSADSTFLNRTLGTPTNNTIWTWSGWFKKCNIGVWHTLFGAITDISNYTFLYFNDTDQITYIARSGGSNVGTLTTTAKYRDVSAWMHVVVSKNGTSVLLYVNGVSVSWTGTTPTASDVFINSNRVHRIGQFNSSDYINGYLTEINFIDGQELTPSSFGETNSTTGVWQPKAYTGTYGNNGFYLNFSDNTSTTTLGDDFSGNNNDWTTNNFSVTAGTGNDSLVDTPTPYGTDTGAGGEVRGNYATLSPLISTENTISNGGLQLVTSVTTGAAPVTYTTMAIPKTGKWYWEYTPTVNGQFSFCGIGAANQSVPYLTYYGNDGQKYVDGVNSNYGASYGNNDVIGVAVNSDSGTVTFYKNGVSQGAITYSVTSNTFFPSFADGTTNFSSTFFVNFGQRPFSYTAPSDFKALVTTNLPTPTVIQGDDYFNTVLYTGTGASQSITGVGFQPDFVWIKERNAAADHGLYDAVRGVQQQLESNTTTDETTESTGLTAFGSDGFTVGSLAQLNTNNDTYVAWNWKESTTSKFDIVTYTGNGTARTISHNLGVVPNMIIVKARTTASTDQGWAVYHSANTAAPATDYLLLNSDAATADLDTVWNDTAPTSSVFSVGTNALVNANNDTYVAYLFASVEGYSAFGSYIGNGNTNGPMVYLNFYPAFVMIKRTPSTGNWIILDSKRQGYNVDNESLFSNLNNAEDPTDLADLLSNGFKIRSTSTSVNDNAQSYIYAAFAKNPFKFALAR